jgi:hypothetical protein
LSFSNGSVWVEMRHSQICSAGDAHAFKADLRTSAAMIAARRSGSETWHGKA